MATVGTTVGVLVATTGVSLGTLVGITVGRTGSVSVGAPADGETVAFWPQAARVTRIVNERIILLIMLIFLQPVIILEKV